RLIFAAEDLFKVGFASVCLINSDSPTVPAETFTQAADLLRLPGDRIVLGPCDDGGYYLIGFKKLHREIFERIDWSTEHVLDQTLQRAADIGAEVKLLPAGYDVDDRATLERLCSELLGEKASRNCGIAPNTQKFLVEIVFHEAAYGGYMPEVAKFVHVNSLGTAQMLEAIRENNLPIKKIIVASSQAVYSEGAGECPEHGLVFPSVRPIEQMRKGDWEVHCPICGAITKSVPTPESAPVSGETVYGLTKVDQERLVLLWGKHI